MTDISGSNTVSDGYNKPYTPTTEEVAEIYFQSGYMTTPEQFDRWLAEVKAEAVIELVARIEAAVILLGDDDITPTGRRMNGMSAEKVREFYLRQGEERAIKRIITRLEEHDCPAEGTVFACDCGSFNEATWLIKEEYK
jgi:flavin-dependent dehydrogenase